MMKKPIFLALILVAPLMLVSAVMANDIASSTMYFEGVLTPDGNGGYEGTIDAISGTYYMTDGAGCVGGQTPDGSPCNGGFDVYAKEGGNAYYDDVFQGIIGSDHDAYSEAGGWGDFWSPDIPDYYSYQLTLVGSDWYLEFKNTALATPMAGTVNWDTMYASETGTGSYRGVVPADPDANDGDAALNGGGPQAWDMDWTWGSEVIPLEYPGFRITIEDLEDSNFRVTLTPADQTKADVLSGNDVPGKGMSKAPGLQKLPPNDNFAKGRGK